MRNRVAAVLFFFSFTLLGGIAIPLQAAPYKIKWFLAHKNLDYFEEAALDFKKNVETGSNGNITVEIVMETDENSPGNQAREPQVAAMVAKGEVQMGHSFTDVMGALDPRLYAFEAPYLLQNYKQMESLFEGPLGSELLEGLRAHGLVGLSFTYSGGACGIATTDRELRRPEDLKGLKVGVFSDKVNEAWLTSLGATPVPIEHNLDSILPEARKGALDAVVTTWRNFEQQALSSDFKYMNLMNSTYLVTVTYINKGFYDSLPAEYRSLIMQASREAGRIERAKTIMLNEDSKLDMVGNGVRAVYLTQDNRRRFVDSLQPAYKNSIERIIGKDIVERMRGISGDPQDPPIPFRLTKL